MTRALSLVLMLLAAPVLAQANICGAGKNCKVQSIKTGNGTAAAPAYSYTDDPDTGIYRSAANTLGFSTGATARGTITSTGAFAWGGSLSIPASTLLSLGGSSLYESASGRLTTGNLFQWSGAAFASFPAAAAANAGSIQYDTTNAVLRQSNGSAWLVLDKEFSFSGYMPTAALAAGYTVAKTTLVKPATSKHLTAESPLGAGTTTTGNVTIVLYNVTTAAANCTLTVACNAGGATTTCSTAAAAGDVLRLDVDTSACGGAGAFDYNITAQLAGG